MKTPKVEVTNELNLTIIHKLREFGVPAHLLGYEYSKTAIAMIMGDPEILKNGVTKVLYPQIAKEHGTTASRVERAIRHTIETVISRHYTDELADLFGGCLNPHTGKITNSEFLATIAERIREEIGVYG